jgi:hypothetical protein
VSLKPLITRTCTRFEHTVAPGGKTMKTGLNLILEDTDLIELCRILMDRDADAALAFLQQHLKGKARDLLEGG